MTTAFVSIKMTIRAQIYQSKVRNYPDKLFRFRSNHAVIDLFPWFRMLGGEVANPSFTWNFWFNLTGEIIQTNNNKRRACYMWSNWAYARFAFIKDSNGAGTKTAEISVVLSSSTSNSLFQCSLSRRVPHVRQNMLTLL